MASVTVRVDDETKLRAAEIVEYFGLDLSTATRAFYKQIVRENRIPLNFSELEPNAESLQALAEAEEMRANGDPGFKTVDELSTELGIK